MKGIVLQTLTSDKVDLVPVPGQAATMRYLPGQFESTVTITIQAPVTCPEDVEQWRFLVGKEVSVVLE